MKALSIGSAWDETVALVKAQPGVLFLIAFGFVSLPTLIFQAVAPSVQPGQPPQAGAWMLLFIPVFLLSILGTLTVTAIGLGGHASPRDAFAHALRRLPAALGAALLLGLFFALLAVPLTIVIALFTPSPATATAISMLAILLLFVIIWVRLMLLSPVALAEPLGPLAILRRSFRLTAGNFWKLLGFLLALLVAFIVVLVAANAVLGSLIILVAGQPQEGSLAAVLLLLIGGVLNAVLGLFLSVMVARIYAQLTRPTAGT
jgi:hypothetical protein